MNIDLQARMSCEFIPYASAEAQAEAEAEAEAQAVAEALQKPK